MVMMMIDADVDVSFWLFGFSDWMYLNNSMAYYNVYIIIILLLSLLIIIIIIINYSYYYYIINKGEKKMWLNWNLNTLLIKKLLILDWWFCFNC